MDSEKTLPAYIQLLFWAIRLEDPELTTSQRIVLIQLCNFYSGKSAFVEIEYKKFELRTGLAKRTIIKVLQLLEKKGYIVIHSRKNEFGGCAPNLYEFNFEKIMLEA